MITPTLYVKAGCPWCDDVVEYFDEHQLPYYTVDVSHNLNAMTEMQHISGQTKAPTMDWEGEVLADFGVDELVPFLREHAVI